MRSRSAVSPDRSFDERGFDCGWVEQVDDAALVLSLDARNATGLGFLAEPFGRYVQALRHPSERDQVFQRFVHGT